MLETARWTPSAGDTQPLELVVVKGKQTKQKLSEAALNQALIQKAPMKAINALKNVKPVAIVPVGYPAMRPVTPKKRAYNEIVHY